jgi:hypothetical protein
LKQSGVWKLLAIQENNIAGSNTNGTKFGKFGVLVAQDFWSTGARYNNCFGHA